MKSFSSHTWSSSSSLTDRCHSKSALDLARRVCSFLCCTVTSHCTSWVFKLPMHRREITMAGVYFTTMPRERNTDNRAHRSHNIIFPVLVNDVRLVWRLWNFYVPFEERLEIMWKCTGAMIFCYCGSSTPILRGRKCNTLSYINSWDCY